MAAIQIANTTSPFLRPPQVNLRPPQDQTKTLLKTKPKPKQTLLKTKPNQTVNTTPPNPPFLQSPLKINPFQDSSQALQIIPTPHFSILYLRNLTAKQDWLPHLKFYSVLTAVQKQANVQKRKSVLQERGDFHISLYEVCVCLERFGRGFDRSRIFLDEFSIGVESFWTKFHRSGIFNLLSVSFSSALLLSQALLVTIFYDMYLS